MHILVCVCLYILIFYYVCILHILHICVHSVYEDCVPIRYVRNKRVFSIVILYYDIVPLLYTGKAESRQRVIEESRSSNSYTEHAARSVCCHGRFAGISLERRKRYISKEELLVAPERRISPVWKHTRRARNGTLTI